MLQTESTKDPKLPENSRGRRMAIKETDSDYVKLAKKGGHTGLLWHEETSLNTNPNLQYQPPDWFCSMPDSLSHISPTTRPVPDFMSYEEFQKSERGALRPLDPPFGSDCKSAWERDAADCNAGEEKISSVSQDMVMLSVTSGDTTETNKFKKVSQKRDSPVCMATLLRFGYVKDHENPPKESPTKPLEEASQLAGSDSTKMEN